MLVRNSAHCKNGHILHMIPSAQNYSLLPICCECTYPIDIVWFIAEGVWVLGDALQFYSFNKYPFCGHSAVMGERVEPGRTRAGFWNFLLIQCLRHEGIIAAL